MSLAFKELRYDSYEDLASFMRELVGPDNSKMLMLSIVNFVGEVVEKRVAERLKYEREHL